MAASIPASTWGARMATACGQCGSTSPTTLTGQCHWYDGRWFCSKVCRHAAGDRSGCYGWDCGCTRYAKKRRLLRGHRAEMRVMMDFIEDRGLEDELQDDMISETGNTNYFLGSDSEMDEGSDVEDPEAQAKEEASALRAETANRQSFLEAVQGALHCRSVQTDLERARMQLEDARSKGL